MTRWDPQTELARLLGALAQEIVAADGEDVRGANVEGERAIRASAGEVRRVIDAVIGDADEPGDLDARPPPAALLRDRLVRQH